MVFIRIIGGWIFTENAGNRLYGGFIFNARRFPLHKRRAAYVQVDIRKQTGTHFGVNRPADVARRGIRKHWVYNRFKNKRPAFAVEPFELKRVLLFTRPVLISHLVGQISNYEFIAHNLRRVHLDLYHINRLELLEPVVIEHLTPFNSCIVSYGFPVEQGPVIG